jgi:hypothetical protein
VKKLLLTSKLSGAIVWSIAKLASITFLSLALSYWIDYLSFITEGKLAAVLITPSLGVPNWSVIYIINTAPSEVKVQSAAEVAMCRRDGRLWRENSVRIVRGTALADLGR